MWVLLVDEYGTGRYRRVSGTNYQTREVARQSKEHAEEWYRSQNFRRARVKIAKTDRLQPNPTPGQNIVIGAGLGALAGSLLGLPGAVVGAGVGAALGSGRR